jgi:hypothetical protein
VTSGKQDIARKDDPVRRNVNKNVALGVRRADLEQLDGLLAHLKGQAAIERFGGQGQLDAAELERTETLNDERRRFGERWQARHAALL